MDAITASQSPSARGIRTAIALLLLAAQLMGLGVVMRRLVDQALLEQSLAV